MARAVAAGATPTDIAQDFGVTPSWVTQIIHSPLFVAEVARLSNDIENQQKISQRRISDELDQLLARSVEVIAQEIHSQKSSARRTDTAFKILDRRGYHPRNDQAGDDNRVFNFVTLTPEPGENPEEAMKRVNAVVREMKRNQIEGDEDVQQNSRANTEGNKAGEWPDGTYALERATAEIPGKQVYRLQLTHGSSDI